MNSRLMQRAITIMFNIDHVPIGDQFLGQIPLDLSQVLQLVQKWN